jgi:molybdenum cofactor sulfurtransferase
MSSILTLVNLGLEKLYIESPKCKEKLEVSLLHSSSCAVEEIDVYGYRYFHMYIYNHSKLSLIINVINL